MTKKEHIPQPQDKVRTENQIEVDAEQGEEHHDTVDYSDENDARDLHHVALESVRMWVRLRLKRTRKRASSQDFVMLKLSHSHCAVASLLVAH